LKLPYPDTGLSKIKMCFFDNKKGRHPKTPPFSFRRYISF